MENLKDFENQNRSEKESESQDLIMQILGGLAEHDKAYRREYFETIFADEDVKFGFIYICSSLVEACEDLLAEEESKDLPEEDIQDVLALEDVAKDVLDFVGMLPKGQTHQDYVEALMQNSSSVPASKGVKVVYKNDASSIEAEKGKVAFDKTPVLSREKIKQTNTKPSKIVVPYQRG